MLVGPEVVTGSTRLKAGTATKLVLNLLTTGAMIRLGKTYGNLMVDLQVRNQKLADRGERIVMEVAAVDRDAARAALEAAGGSVRTAIVMLRTGTDRATAERRIADARYAVQVGIRHAGTRALYAAVAAVGALEGVEVTSVEQGE